eukprot:9159016-Pyramimonas_sp.AAC.1
MRNHANQCEAMQSNTRHCQAMLSTACKVMRSSAKHCNAMRLQSSAAAMQYDAMQCDVMQAMQCGAKRCKARQSD